MDTNRFTARLTTTVSRLAFVAAAAAALAAVPVAAQPRAADGLIPVTTTSAEAREHFNRGIAFDLNARNADAEKEYAEALRLDPAFIQAHALHGAAARNAAGQAEILEAARMDGSLPEAERLVIEGLAQIVRGDAAGSLQSFQRLTRLAPRDPVAFVDLGTALASQNEHAAAVAAFEQATRLDPKSGSAYNGVGYEQLRQGHFAAAIAAFRRYAALAPREPNAQDSLAEALLTAGRFTDAEAAFRKALALDASFLNAWQGIAYARFYRRDWAGGHAAAQKAAAMPAFADRHDVARLEAAAYIAEHRPAEAMRPYEALEKSAGLSPGDQAVIATTRGRMLVEAGQPGEAVSVLETALHVAADAHVPAGVGRGVRSQATLNLLRARAALNDTTGVAKTLADLEAASAAKDLGTQSRLHFGRGIAALTRGDFAMARRELAQCAENDSYCHYEEMLAADRSGDHAGAEIIRKQLTRSYLRQPANLLVHMHLAEQRNQAH
jgi:tetratricopeptide (TPR) repeat protein